MPRINKQNTENLTETLKLEYDFNNRTDLEEIKAFDELISKYHGPWQWEWYCAMQGYYTDYQIKDVKDKEFKQVVPNRLKGVKRKDSDGREYLEPIEAFLQDEVRYKAWKKWKKLSEKQVSIMQPIQQIYDF